MICVTINQTIAPILIAEADALLLHPGETDHKPIPLPTGRISHNAAAANASASTAGDPKRHLKRWKRVFLFYKEHISISGNPRCRWESQASHLPTRRICEKTLNLGLVKIRECRKLAA